MVFGDKMVLSVGMVCIGDLLHFQMKNCQGCVCTEGNSGEVFLDLVMW